MLLGGVWLTFIHFTLIPFLWFHSFCCVHSIRLFHSYRWRLLTSPFHHSVSGIWYHDTYHSTTIVDIIWAFTDIPLHSHYIKYIRPISLFDLPPSLHFCLFCSIPFLPHYTPFGNYTVIDVLLRNFYAPFFCHYIGDTTVIHLFLLLFAFCYHLEGGVFHFYYLFFDDDLFGIPIRAISILDASFDCCRLPFHCILHSFVRRWYHLPFWFWFIIHSIDFLSSFLDSVMHSILFGDTYHLLSIRPFIYSWFVEFHPFRLTFLRYSILHSSVSWWKAIPFDDIVVTHSTTIRYSGGIQAMTFHSDNLPFHSSFILF